jgi:hypothetical protein
VYFLQCGEQTDEDLPLFTKTVQEITAVYILCKASSDEEEESLRGRVLASVPDMAPQRVLFYSSEIGRMAIVRQVNPSVHIEHDLGFCEKLKPHVKKIVLLDANTSPGSRPVARTSPLAGEKPDESCGGGSDCVDTSSPARSSSSSSAPFPTATSLRQVLEIQLE